MGMYLIASILIGTAVFILFQAFFSKPQGISIHDEYKANIVNKSQGRLNLLLGCLFCAVAAYVVTGRVLFALLAIPGGFFVAKWIQTRNEKRRAQLLENQFIQVLSNLITSMQGGSSQYQAFEEIVPRLPSPAKDIFLEIVRRSRTGSTYSEALTAVIKESGWSDLGYLQKAMALYDKTGSNLVDILKHLLENTYEAHADKKYVEATTASIRATCTILSFLPFVLMAISRMIAPDFAGCLYDTTGGFIVIVYVIGSVIIGNILTKRMVEKITTS